MNARCFPVESSDNPRLQCVTGSRMPRVENVNTTDLTGAIALGCRTMQNVFDADDNDIPLFKSRIMPRQSSRETFLAFSAVHSDSSTPGRHLNALLHAEDAARCWARFGRLPPVCLSGCAFISAMPRGPHD